MKIPEVVLPVDLFVGKGLDLKGVMGRLFWLETVLSLSDFCFIAASYGDDLIDRGLFRPLQKRRAVMRQSLRKVLKIGGIATGVLVLAAAAFVVWFAYLFAGYEDVARARYFSPDGTLDAVVVDRFTNATVPDPLLIYMVRHVARATGEPQ